MKNHKKNKFTIGLSKKVMNGELTQTQAAKELNVKFGENVNSAKIAITVYKKLVSGLEFKRSLNAPDMKYYLDTIMSEGGAVSLEKPIRALRKHIHYYEKKNNVTLRALRKLATDYEKLFEQTQVGFSASRLRTLGLEILMCLSGFYSNSTISNSDKDWEFQILELNNGFNIRCCKWRDGSMPSYLILYKKNKYILELDMSMLVFNQTGYSWYIKSAVQNKLSKHAIAKHIPSGIEKMPDDYRQRMLRNKQVALSGGDKPKHGYKLVEAGTFEIVVESLAKLLDAVIAEHGGKFAVQRGKNASYDDITKKQMRAVSVRQGQGKFRENLLNAYNFSCAITGWSPEDVLDACHIEAHSIAGNNETSNGILLRTDLHNLFDRNLLKINPNNFKVEIDPSLQGTNYWQLNNKKLVSTFKPDPTYLVNRYNAVFKA